MRNVFCVLGCAASVAVSSPALGAIQGPNAVTLIATSGTHSAQYTVLTAGLNSSGGVQWWSQTWQPGSEYELRDPGDNTLVAKLSGINCLFNDDPVVSVGFSVVAGAAPTSFTFTSAVTTFPSDLYTATISAGVQVTDTLGDGALFTGNYGGFAYQAYCNGAVLANLIPTYGFTGGTVPENGSFGPVNVSASSMQASYSFTLSPFDQASGNSTYTKTLVPAPGAAAMLGLGGLLACRRRRA